MAKKISKETMRGLLNNLTWSFYQSSGSNDITNNNTILIGFNHKKKEFKRLLNNYGVPTQPSRVLTRANYLDGWEYIPHPDKIDGGVYFLKKDVKEIFLGRFVEMKEGGVYDIIDEHFYKKSLFQKWKREYEKGLRDRNLDLITERMRGNHHYDDYFKYYEED